MGKKVKYEALANQVVGLLGGKDNIVYFTHCITRLRFNVKDKSMVKKIDIEKIPNIVGSQWQGEQLQVIIGQDVNDAYKLICEVNALYEQEGIQENVDEKGNKKKNKFDFKKVLLTIVDCLAPVFPVLIGSSLLKSICILLSTYGVVSADSSTYIFFYGAADAGLYYLPIYLGATSAKRFGANQGLGMLMGAMLLHPGIQSAFSSGEALNIFGVPVTTQFVYYASSIVPAILLVFVMSYVEKFLKKILPTMIRSMLTPLLVLVIMVPLGFIIIGPLAAIIGVAFSSLINGIYNTFGLFAVGALSALFPWIISTGMHTAIMPPYYIWAISTMGYDPIAKLAGFIANINQGAAGFAVSLRLKNKESKAVAISSSITSMLVGISEPVLFGYNLKYITPMYACSIGGLVAGLIAGAMQVKGFAGNNGLVGLMTFGLGGVQNLIWFCIAILVGAIVTFTVTLILFKGDPNE